MIAHHSHPSLWLIVTFWMSCSGPLAASEPLTEDACRRDHELLLADIAAARAAAVRELQPAIDRATSDDERADLVAQREEYWDREEQERVFADVNLRDCLRYVREQRDRRQ